MIFNYYGLKTKRPEKGRRVKLVIYGLFFLVTLAFSGCTKVEPWDKGNFTKASMEVNPWSMPLYLSVKTTEKALESSKGGTNLGGGGCGCG